MKSSVLPTRLNYVWIGQPTDGSYASPGHDTEYVKRMANRVAGEGSHQVYFWCLKRWVEIYQAAFRGYAVIVCCIEDHLDASLVNPLLREESFQVRALMQCLLSEARSSCRDFVLVKEIVTFFLLASLGDYVLDTNVKPKPGEELCLDKHSNFHLPVFNRMPKSASDIDIWMMYSPAAVDQHSIPLRAVRRFCATWRTLQNTYKGDFNTEHYYKEVSSIALNTLIRFIQAGEQMQFWLVTNTSLGKEEYELTVPALKVIKHYTNSHKYENRLNYNDHKLFKEKYAEFLSATSVRCLPSSIRREIAGYICDSEEKMQVSPSLGIFSPQRTVDSGLAFAAKFGYHQDLEDMLSHTGVDVNQKITATDAGIVDATCLHLAVLENKVECVEVLLQHKACSNIAAKRIAMFKDITAYQLANRVLNADQKQKMEETFKKFDQTPQINSTQHDAVAPAGDDTMELLMSMKSTF
jgi:hypothetical protein